MYQIVKNLSLLFPANVVDFQMPSEIEFEGVTYKYVSKIKKHGDIIGWEYYNSDSMTELYIQNNF